MSPHREAELTAWDADWLRGHCVHNSVEGHDCTGQPYRCDYCTLAEKIEQHIKLRDLDTLLAAAREISRKYNMSDHRWDDDYTGEDAT